MTEPVQLIVSQKKALADESKLFIPTQTSVPLNNITSLLLKGYAITGAAGALPSHVIMRFRESLGGASISACNVGGQHGTIVRANDPHTVLFPPGGAVTQARTSISLLHNDRSVNLEGATIELLAQNAAGVYVPYTDYTDVVIEFEACAYKRTSVVRHGYTQN